MNVQTTLHRYWIRNIRSEPPGDPRPVFVRLHFGKRGAEAYPPDSRRVLPPPPETAVRSLSSDLTSGPTSFTWTSTLAATGAPGGGTRPDSLEMRRHLDRIRIR